MSECMKMKLMKLKYEIGANLFKLGKLFLHPETPYSINIFYEHPYDHSIFLIYV